MGGIPLFSLQFFPMCMRAGQRHGLMHHAVLLLPEQAPSRAQYEWLRCSRAIRNITFLPRSTPCGSTLSTAPAQLAQRSAGALPVLAQRLPRLPLHALRIHARGPARAARAAVPQVRCLSWHCACLEIEPILSQ